jgi:hypothetical protein
MSFWSPSASRLAVKSRVKKSAMPYRNHFPGFDSTGRCSLNLSFAHSQAPNMRIDLHIPGLSLPKAGEKLFSQHAIILSRLFRATDFRKHERSPNSYDLLDGICCKWLGDRYFEKLQGIKVNNNLRILPEEYLWPVAGGRHHTGTEPPVPIRRTKYVMEAPKSINLMQRWYSEGI